MVTDTQIAKILFVNTKDDYPLFSEYCLLLDKGLRKEALVCLNKFLDLTTTWDYSLKSAFCSLIFKSSIISNDVDALLNMNIKNKLIKPTLLDMTLIETSNYLPFKWYGEYFQDLSFLKKAHEIFPHDESTKLLLLARIEYSLWFSVHHLPDGYLGDYIEDINDIQLGFSILETMSGKKKENYEDLFLEYKVQIESYIKNKQ